MATGVLGVVAMIAAVVAAVLLYFAPLFVAWMAKSRQVAVVAVINVVFGWTVLGWVAALVIALWTEKPQPQQWAPQWQPQYPYPPQQQWPAQRPMWHSDAATPPYGNPHP